MVKSRVFREKCRKKEMAVLSFDTNRSLGTAIYFHSIYYFETSLSLFQTY